MNAQTGVISLGMMAQLDMSDVASIKRIDLPAGLYMFECKGGKMSERDKDGEQRFGASMVFEVLEADGIVDRDYATPEAIQGLIGQKHTEFRQIVPEDFHTGVGYIKGFLEQLGVEDVSGPLGGANDDEGNPIIGLLDRINGFTFRAKIKRKTGNDGVTRSNIEPLPVRKS